MSKRAMTAGTGKTLPWGARLLAGAVLAAPLFLAEGALAQQAYYLPQASSSPVSVNYGALSPYGAPAYNAPAYNTPAGFQPYGYAAQPRVTSSPKSVFTPAQPVYAVNPAYPAPAYAAPAYGQVYGYSALPPSQPFVAPYANPAFAPRVAGALPASTPTATSPQSYLNVPGATPVSDAAPAKKKKKKKKAAAAPMPASTPTAVEEGAAAQVAAAEAALESTPAPTQTPAPAAAAPAVAEVAAPAEPLPAPTPPAEPEAVPASVPSPVANATTSVTAAPTAEAPAAEATSSAEAPAADAASTADATSEATSDAQVASAEEPAETTPDTGGNAVLPAGGTRIVFEGDADELPQGATGDLDAIADKMMADENIKVQVLAYSSGTPDAESQARRKALARGLEVRKYLIGKGVRSNRIDVRALGTKSEGNPADRVDIVPSAG